MHIIKMLYTLAYRHSVFYISILHCTVKRAAPWLSVLHYIQATTFHPRMCPPEEILRGAQNISFAADILCTTYLLRDQVKVFSVPFFVMQLNWKQTSSKQSSTKFKLSCIGRNCTMHNRAIAQMLDVDILRCGNSIKLRFCFCVQSSVPVVQLICSFENAAIAVDVLYRTVTSSCASVRMQFWKWHLKLQQDLNF